jgi:hypothetical protein
MIPYRIAVLASVAFALTLACGSEPDDRDDWWGGATIDAGSGDARDAEAAPIDAASDAVSPPDAPTPDAPDASVPGQSWIGSACASAGDCDYPSAQCLLDDFPGGMCSLSCDGLCPDSDDPAAPTTFCTERPASPQEGACVSRCDWGAFGKAGCRSGYVCRWRERFGQASVVCDVCVPDDGTWATACIGDEVRQPNVGLVEPPGVGGCPSGMSPIAGTGLCMDRWEAHLVEVLPDGSTSPWSPYFPPVDGVMRAVSAPDAVPQGYVSEVAAQAACLEAGKRLCTRDEWEAACMGPSDNTYPYGDIRLDGECNDARDVHPAVEYFGTSDAWIWSELGHPCISQLDASLALTGSHDGCVTGDGIFDMMGNLHEWVDDPDGTFKGGFYVDTVLNGEGCLYATTAHDVTHWDYSTGFRCCATL